MAKKVVTALDFAGIINTIKEHPEKLSDTNFLIENAILNYTNLLELLKLIVADLQEATAEVQQLTVKNEDLQQRLDTKEEEYDVLANSTAINGKKHTTINSDVDSSSAVGEPQEHEYTDVKPFSNNNTDERLPTPSSSETDLQPASSSHEPSSENGSAVRDSNITNNEDDDHLNSDDFMGSGSDSESAESEAESISEVSEADSDGDEVMSHTDKVSSDSISSNDSSTLKRRGRPRTNQFTPMVGSPATDSSEVIPMGKPSNRKLVKPFPEVTIKQLANRFNVSKEGLMRAARYIDMPMKSHSKTETAERDLRPGRRSRPRAAKDAPAASQSPSPPPSSRSARATSKANKAAVSKANKTGEARMKRSQVLKLARNERLEKARSHLRENRDLERKMKDSRENGEDMESDDLDDESNDDELDDDEEGMKYYRNNGGVDEPENPEFLAVEGFGTVMTNREGKVMLTDGTTPGPSQSGYSELTWDSKSEDPENALVPVYSFSKSRIKGYDSTIEGPVPTTRKGRKKIYVPLEDILSSKSSSTQEIEESNAEVPYSGKYRGYKGDKTRRWLDYDVTEDGHFACTTCFPKAVYSHYPSLYQHKRTVHPEEFIQAKRQKTMHQHLKNRTRPAAHKSDELVFPKPEEPSPESPFADESISSPGAEESAGTPNSKRRSKKYEVGPINFKMSSMYIKNKNNTYQCKFCVDKAPVYSSYHGVYFHLRSAHTDPITGDFVEDKQSTRGKYALKNKALIAERARYDAELLNIKLQNGSVSPSPIVVPEGSVAVHNHTSKLLTNPDIPELFIDDGVVPGMSIADQVAIMNAQDTRKKEKRLKIVYKGGKDSVPYNPKNYEKDMQDFQKWAQRQSSLKNLKLSNKAGGGDSDDEYDVESILVEPAMSTDNEVNASTRAVAGATANTRAKPRRSSLNKEANNDIQAVLQASLVASGNL